MKFSKFLEYTHINIYVELVSKLELCISAFCLFVCCMGTYRVDQGSSAKTKVIPLNSLHWIHDSIGQKYRDTPYKSMYCVSRSVKKLTLDRFSTVIQRE